MSPSPKLPALEPLASIIRRAGLTVEEFLKLQFVTSFLAHLQAAGM